MIGCVCVKGKEIEASKLCDEMKLGELFPINYLYSIMFYVVYSNYTILSSFGICSRSDRFL